LCREREAPKEIFENETKQESQKRKTENTVNAKFVKVANVFPVRSHQKAW